MCLYSNNIKPLVAKKDIIVYKYFYEMATFLLSPYREMTANYGKNMVAKGDMPLLPEDYSDNIITEGVIHSNCAKGCRSYLKENITSVKATIKAGTPFFVSFDGCEIASRELLINGTDDQEIEPSELEETQKTIRELVRNQNVSKDGVKAGDVLLSDKRTFLTVEKVTKENYSQVIGIVGFIRPDGTPHVISLKNRRDTWMETDKEEPVNLVQGSKNAISDFNGKGHTETLAKKHASNLEVFPAIDYCVTYKTEGTKEGDWYLPAAGEMLQTIRNFFIVNGTVKSLNAIAGTKIADELVYGLSYWSSSESSKTTVWSCRTDNTVCHNVNSKFGVLYFRPSLSITIKNKEEKPLLPYSNLVLFAKGWLAFPRLNKYFGDDLRFINEQLKAVFTMSGYTCKNNDDVMSLVLIAIDRIRDAFNENGQQLPRSFFSYYAFYDGVERYRRVYCIETHEEALLLFALSEMRMLDINGFVVNNVDYRSMKIRRHDSKTSETYASCQRRFNNAFKDMLSSKSFTDYGYANFRKCS